MFQVNYDKYTILIGEETGKWVCFQNSVPCKSSTKINDKSRYLSSYPESIRGLLSDKLNKIDEVEQTKSPFALLIIVTSNICNMECKYCYMSSKKSGYDKSQMITSKKMIEIIDAFTKEYSDDSFQVLFQGGEPMLSFDEIKTTIEHYKKAGKKYVFCIQSNGTLFNKSNLKFIKEYGVRIGISRDGISDSDGELREIASHNINSILAQKEQLMQANGLKYGVISVVSKYNVENVCEYALNLFGRGINKFSFNPFYPIGRGDGLDSSFPPIVQYTEEMKKLFDILYRRNKTEGFLELDLYAENNLSLLWERIFKRRYETSCCNKAPCGAGGTTFTVDWNGDIYPCTYFMPNMEQGHRLGNIENIHKAVTNTNASIVKKRDTNRIQKCNNCPYKRICGGGGCTGAIYYAHGLLNESYYCDYFQEIIPYMITATMKFHDKKVLSNF